MQARSRLKIENVEPRLLFSADLPAWHNDIDNVVPHTEQLTQLVSSKDQSANESVLPSSIATTVVIIDAATPDYQSLVDDIKNNNDSVATYLLNAESDGLAQITSILANHNNIESLQIISHGKDGQLDLGSTSITSSTLLSRAEEISQWRDTFSNDADILIYGCDLAASEAGEQFVNVLGYLSSTDVAASEDKTGSALNGADWTLEYKTGSIESELAVSSKLQNDYTGVLATITVTTELDTNLSGIQAGNPFHDITWLTTGPTSGEISLREAIIAGNNSGSDTTTIILGSGDYQITAVGTGGVEAEYGDLDITTSIVIVGNGVENTSIDANALSRVFEVHATGTLNLSELQVTNGDSGVERGGAVRIQIGGTLIADTVDFFANTGGLGGAISNSDTIELTDVSLRDNTGSVGGAIHNTATATLNRITVSGNTANQEGGGIYSQSPFDFSFSLTNSTISGNTSTSSFGGGLYLNTGQIVNSTFTNNTAATAGGIYATTSVELQNVISANNNANNGINADFSGAVNSGGGNVVVNTDGSGFNSFTDSIGTAPLLGTLQDNGGKTQTHALLANSVGINFGTSGTNVPALDQRDAARIGQTDSGSFEFSATGDANTVPTLITPAQFSVEENYALALPVTVGDADGDTLAYSLSGSNDDALFNIDAISGDITFINPPDFEAPVDGDTNNVYNITLTADDSNGGVLVQALEISVTNIASSSLVVTTLADTIDGDISDVESLIASKGADGAISLKEAITAANAETEHVSITFDISDAPVSGVHRIMLGEELPIIENSVTIDGTTDSDYVDSPVIVLDGSAIAGSAHGLQLTTVNTAEIRGLGIVNFSASAISINLSTNIEIVGNVIGTLGSVAEANAIGVDVNNSSNVQIGGSTPEDRNIISGNTSSGVLIRSAGSTNNTVQGNYIGTNATGQLAIANGDGISFLDGANDNTIGGSGANEGNVISGNLGGVVISASNNNSLLSNNIGTNLTGTAAIANTSNGITIEASSEGNTIGNGTAAGANQIAGNVEYGIRVTDSGTTLNTIDFNFIGIDRNGSTAIANNESGVALNGGSTYTVVSGNVISGNDKHGVFISGADTAHNTVSSNVIGTDSSGTSSVANLQSGVYIEQGALNNTIGGDRLSGQGNIISGNGSHGVSIRGITTTGNTVAGNMIGTDISGSLVLSNATHGIVINNAPNNTIGGATLGLINVISGNNGVGIYVTGADSSGAEIIGNHIGTDLDGNIALANGQEGLLVDSSAADILVGGTGTNEGNLISGNARNGILLSGTNDVTVQGNQIGTDSLGTSAISNGRHGIHLIGSSTGTIIGVGDLNAATASNVISGNTLHGIRAEANASETLIAGNLIGLAVGGLSALGNGTHGIGMFSANNTIGGALASQRNVIGSNEGDGIRLFQSASNNQVIGNYIGVAADGIGNVGNTGSGIYIGSSNNTIGGSTLSYQNVIANQGSRGVVMTTAAQDNTVIGNTFYGNQSLAIDLGFDWITNNDNMDGDSGSNSLQNYPVISQATLVAADTVAVVGELNSSADSTFRIEVFANSQQHSSGHGEAQELLGAFDVTTDASGIAIFSELLSGTSIVAAGNYISATATVVTAPDTFLSTSELSISVEITDAPTNTSPTTIGLPNLTVEEDSVTPTVNLTGYFTDIEDSGAGLNYSLLNISDLTILTTATVSSAGILTLPLAPNENGTTDITIVATDSQGASVQSTFTLTVDPVNDLPIVTSTDSYSISENTTVIGTVAGTDVDGNAPIYTLIANADAAKFTINAITGELSFLTAPDAENPGDIGANNTYNITLEVDDGTGIVHQAITIEVTDINEGSVGPIVDQLALANQVMEGAGAGSNVGIDVGASDPDISDNVTYDLTIDPSGIFTIDHTTGVVTVATSALLDRETAASHTIEVRATSDDGSFSLQSFTIEVLDLNDNAPAITPGQVFNVLENTQSPFVLGMIAGTDADSSSVLQNWTIQTGNTSGLFQIDAATGEISVADTTQLVFESITPYALGISVSDGTNTSATQALIVNAVEVNDPPVFTSIASSSLLEGDTYSQLIQVVDPEGSPIQISAPALPSWLTFVDNGDGTATLSGTPAGADVGFNTVVLTATDGVTDATPLIYFVTVTDVNHAPTITFAATHTLDEPTQLVGTVVGTDADNDTLTYSLATTGDSPAFTLDPVTGNLSFTAPTDAENPLDTNTNTNNIYQITVQVNDGLHTTEQAVTIEVQDANDNTPVIQANQIYSIEEDASNTDVVAAVIASDADSSSQLQEWSIDSGNLMGVFEIDQDTGELSVSDEFQLDFETTPQYILGITVTDGINSSATENVVVDLLDINEAPSFITTPVTNITEDTLYSQLIEAIDPEGTPVEITATSLPSWLNLTTHFDNTVTLSGTPANADIGVHNVVLDSNDGALASEPLIFTITVSNTNDLPVINFPSTVVLDENIATVGTVSSTDDDVGDIPSYSLVNSDDASLFEIDAVTGELNFLTAADAENPLDIGADNVYNITIQVSDGSSTPVSQGVSITVNNVNEFAASGVSDQNIFANIISENAQIGSTVGLTAQASDLDSNDTITYSFDTANNSFAIDALSGIVSTSAILDFETDTDHELIIRATSSDGSFTVQTFTIVVTDLNDNAPEVVTAQTFAIAEDTAPNTLIGNLLASDTDTVGALQNWQIVSGNEDSNFTLHPTTGELGLGSNAVLDFETTQQYTLSVSVSDGNNNSTITDVLINVLNANETPQFTSANSAVATELSAFNFTVVTSDVDSGDSFDITATSLPSWLSLSSTSGSSTATLSGTPNHADVGTQAITLEVTDAAGISTTQIFLLSVLDINQSPVITNSTSATATEDTLFSHVLTANDPDNDALSYTAGSLPAWLTLTDNGDGTATIQGIPKNADVGNHSVVIDLFDGDLAVIQVVNIEVINVNDLPEIAFPEMISVDENTTLVGTVTSNDIDGDTPIYSLASVGDYQLFSIDASTGELSLTTAADAENAADANTDNVYEITVQVSDGSPTPVSKDVLITIIDVNEFGITNLIDTNTNADSLIENSASGSLIGITVSANDADISDSVSYSLLQDSNGLFEIDESTGEITQASTASADYEQTQNHVVVVQATSSDGSTSTQSKDISIGDVNDNAPVIDTEQLFTILENAPAGQQISTVTASDVDTVGAPPSWTIVGGNDSGIFAINSVTGELSANDTTALNFEQTQQYALQVQVSDGLQTATRILNVAVLDVNEPPVINNTQHFSVVGFTGQIGSIEVTDPETDAITSIAIVGGTGQAVFEFGEGDHIVQTTSITPGIYTLDVIVTDDGGLSTEATLEIRVIDSDGVPTLGGAEAISSTGATTNTTSMISGTNEPEPEPVAVAIAMQEIAESEPEQVGEVTTPEETQPEASGIAESIVNAEGLLSITDARFTGSQANQEGQLHIADRTDGSQKPSSGKTDVRASTVAMEVLIQNSGSLIQGFNIDLNNVNISTTLTPALLSALSDINSDVNSAAKKSEIELELAIKTGTAVSVTLTVGIITWLMQTGAFLTTALSTAPLWRSLDPIPVLISSENDEDDDMEQFDD